MASYARSRSQVALGLGSIVAAAIVATACAGSATDAESTTTQVDAVATTVTTTSTTVPPTTTTTTTLPPETTTTLPADAAPPELQGTWVAELENGEVVFLALRATTYQITRGPNSATGKVSVEGNQISFFEGSVCDGMGSYTWSFEGDSLTFAVADGDPCTGRTPVLDQVTYTLQF